jgi:hypothetical protein
MAADAASEPTGAGAARHRLALGGRLLVAALLLTGCGGSVGDSLPAASRTGSFPTESLLPNATGVRPTVSQPTDAPTASESLVAPTSLTAVPTPTRTSSPTPTPTGSATASASKSAAPSATTATATSRTSSEPAAGTPTASASPSASASAVASEPTPVADDDPPWWVWALVAVALAGGLGWFVRERRRSHSVDRPDDPPAEQS